MEECLSSHQKTLWQIQSHTCSTLVVTLCYKDQIVLSQPAWEIWSATGVKTQNLTCSWEVHFYAFLLIFIGCLPYSYSVQCLDAGTWRSHCQHYCCCEKWVSWNVVIYILFLLFPVFFPTKY